MAGAKPRFLFFNGELVPYAEARIHVLSTTVKYAAAIFEGARAYLDPTAGRLNIFRLPEHLDRLRDSARIARIELPYDDDTLTRGLVGLIQQNGLREDLHIRITAYVGEDDGGLASVGDVGMSMAAMPMGRFDALAEDAGLSVCVSAWRRIGDDAMPPRVKSIANYHNGRLALLDAKAAGFQDAILLDARGKVTEGPGYNIFVVRGDQVLTPPVTSGILEGVTRDTLIRLFADRFGVTVVEREIDRTELYVADEAFFCGSGKEVTPIAAIDHRPMKHSGVGPWTARIRDAYLEVARGQGNGYAAWLLPVL